QWRDNHDWPRRDRRLHLRQSADEFASEDQRPGAQVRKSSVRSSPTVSTVLLRLSEVLGLAGCIGRVHQWLQRSGRSETWTVLLSLRNHRRETSCAEAHEVQEVGTGLKRGRFRPGSERSFRLTMPESRDWNEAE